MTKPRSFRGAVQACLGLLLAACASAGRAAEPGFLSVEQRAEDFAAFCRFVDEDYAYFDLKRTDWTRACTSYAAQVGGATDRDAYIALLERALGELYDAHAHLGTHTQRSPRLVPSQTDLVATWAGGKAVIEAVRQGSAAEAVGLRPGDEVIAIEGETVAAVVARIEPKYLLRADPAARAWALQAALAGRHEREVIRLSIRSGGRLQEIEFAAAHSPPAAPLSHQRIGRVGHVRIHNSLGDPALVPAFDHALAAMPGVRALVIDLRDTPSGGTSSVARGIMGRLVGRPLRYQRHELVAEFRSHGIRRVWDEYVLPRGVPFLRPVVVLVGPWTGSMSEGLAIGLNATRGAPVLGRPMAHLLGALGETVLPHSKIAVRVATEKLFHIDGTPREAFVPCAVRLAGATPRSADPELDSAVGLARTLGRSKPAPLLGRVACPACIAAHSNDSTPAPRWRWCVSTVPQEFCSVRGCSRHLFPRRIQRQGMRSFVAC